MRRTDLRLANADVTVPTTDASPEAEPPATGEPTTTVDYLPPPSSPPPAPLTTQITEPSTIPSPATLESAPEGSFDQGLDAVVVSDSVPIADATLATASDQATAMPVTVRIENQSMSASHMQTMPIPAPGPYADPDNTLSVGDVRPTGKVPPDATARIAQAAAWKAVSKPAEPAEVSAEAMPSPPSMHGLLANATTPDVAEPTDPAREIVELELTLSQTVTQEIGEWQLRDLYQQAERLVQSTTDPAIQVQAKTLVERIRQFAELRQRHLQLSGQPPVTGEPISLASALTPTGQQSANDYSEQVRMPVDAQPPNQFPSASAMPSAATSYAPPNHQATPFAGQGWLVPVVTSRTDLPKFALTDDQGNVRQFVSAYPGLNLRRYQRQQVGIVGRQMAQPGQTTPHLIAERIVLLDRHRR
jgi:hypothetical protein